MTIYPTSSICLGTMMNGWVAIALVNPLMVKTFKNGEACQVGNT